MVMTERVPLIWEQHDVHECPVEHVHDAEEPRGVPEVNLLGMRMIAV